MVNWYNLFNLNDLNFGELNSKKLDLTIDGNELHYFKARNVILGHAFGVLKFGDYFINVRDGYIHESGLFQIIIDNQQNVSLGVLQ